MVLTLFMVLSTLRFCCSLDKDNPYLDKAQTTERNYKTGKYEIVNNFKMPYKIAMTIIKLFYLECGLQDHIANELHHCACFSD
jgi:hypothetical protein